MNGRYSYRGGVNWKAMIALVLSLLPVVPGFLHAHKVTPSEMETNADWSPFEGWELAGFSRTTLSRGEVIVDDDKVVGKAGHGKWLPRTMAGLSRARA